MWVGVRNCVIVERGLLRLNYSFQLFRVYTQFHSHVEIILGFGVFPQQVDVREGLLERVHEGPGEIAAVELVNNVDRVDAVFG